jgi:hypothetical protein
MKKLLFILAALTICECTFSQDTTSMKYFPLKVGNRWTWYTMRTYAPGPDHTSLKILRTLTANNHSYFVSQRDVRYVLYADTVYTYLNYYRIDSVTGNLYNYDSINHVECLTDSLNSQKGDSALTSCGGQWYINDTLTYSIFGQYFKSKKFSWSNYFEASGYRIYALNIGMVYSSGQAMMSYTTVNLLGCLIDEVLHGDTSFIVGVNQLGVELPKSYSLYQNYPNPFNPSTKIKFDIRSNVKSEKSLQKNGGQANVKLIIYDALGREITTLINEQLNPGTYEVEWDASSFPSGVYFYKLVAGNYSLTMKMILIR